MSATRPSLKLEGEGDDWRLHLNGDWSLAAMASIETELRSLPADLRGTLVCDWSEAESPGIGSVWALLMRLADFGRHLDVRHRGDPPHFLELLQKLGADRQAGQNPRVSPAVRDGPVGTLGRWAVLQGFEARAVIEFFGRLVAVLGQIPARPRA